MALLPVVAHMRWPVSPPGLARRLQPGARMGASTGLAAAQTACSPACPALLGLTPGLGWTVVSLPLQDSSPCTALSAAVSAPGAICALTRVWCQAPSLPGPRRQKPCRASFGLQGRPLGRSSGCRCCSFCRDVLSGGPQPVPGPAWSHSPSTRVGGLGVPGWWICVPGVHCVHTALTRKCQTPKMRASLHILPRGWGWGGVGLMGLQVGVAVAPGCLTPPPPLCLPP